MTKKQLKVMMSYHKTMYQKYYEEWKKVRNEERQKLYTLQKEFGLWEGYLMFNKTKRKMNHDLL